MSDSSEKIYSSPPSEIDDDLWLEEGKRMVMESLPAVRSAANALITALGVLQGIYLVILGFGKPLPLYPSIFDKVLLIMPLLLWLGSFYLCIRVIMTRKLAVFISSPSDIRAKSVQMLLRKQRQLQLAFWLMTAGLLLTIGTFFLRL
ncbi:MAG: hypothetical protein ONB11_12490 [candidate division KSB1 bacterium]|nr:hypothetical protein [candidate division KSB1 bacterium]